MKYNDIKLVNNESKQRYELTVEGLLSFIDYEIKDNIIYLTHTEVPEELEGKGIAAGMVEKAFNDIEERGLKLVPYCSYVATFLKRHPQWNRLLSEE
ncbi:hypothetical protein BDE36_3058 [Arcticibacter tournemirensis]|uniref:N-acetyltransferase n=1 Tax=Arcticibacter tournemirensis TaxID=699437 RepID=A0A4Q0MFX1_9SPHI|nr:GNAT family N-acetyltransferase [Arcticibacter tournemirensis]KAA8476114.1 N-acetyltransferase [Arcticibacter tournemirensis]RXF72397.1 N-acetyltransferase [Arcticibacter tournemirensis]TQM51282.1 hypothetical protein BDE36_3058 [Arcticibacter tournemirensis]